MHVFFSGIGGAGIGPLARIALSLGHTVSGSDMAESKYLDELRELGVTIHKGQDGSQIQAIHNEQPIDWYVYASALKMSNPNHPELMFASNNCAQSSKRDVFLNHILQESGMKLLAIAGTHGKTTTTAMCIWLMKELGLNPSWSVGGKIPFGDMGHANEGSAWFIYECDEFDRNFLSFSPDVSVISGMAYDHHEIYPTLEDYNRAFAQFIAQSKKTFAWETDSRRIFRQDKTPDSVLTPNIAPADIMLIGEVNRQDAAIAASAIADICAVEVEKVIEIMNRFPGVTRRFEYITPNIVTDYAHTPEKIAGCLQLAEETGRDIVVIYEPLTDRRQHYVQEQYRDLFNYVKKLYWVPAFQAREHTNYPAIPPRDLIKKMSNQSIAEPAEVDDVLAKKIRGHIADGDLIVGLTGGGANSLDSWLRNTFA